jgi:hypothetical protein
MQKLAAEKFHFEPPSSFTSFNHLVGAGERHRRHLDARVPFAIGTCGAENSGLLSGAEHELGAGV